MGHVTIVNNDIDKAHKIAEIVKNTIKVIRPLESTIKILLIGTKNIDYE